VQAGWAGDDGDQHVVNEHLNVREATHFPYDGADQGC
jgi:hypothetical protein